MKSVLLAVNDAGHADIRPHELPTASICPNPGLEAEVVGSRFLGREWRPGKHMPSPVEVDEREDLPAVPRVEADGEPV